MDPQQFEIYSELRQTKQELKEKLQNVNCSSLIKPLIEDEIKDIETALTKLEKGTYGTCEISGELIPDDLLSIIPTLKSMDDCKTIHYVIHKSTT